MLMARSRILVCRFLLLLLFGCCFITTTFAEDDASLEKEKAELVRRWEMPFVHLKSLQMSAKWLRVGKEHKTEERSQIYGEFTYHDPKFLDDLTFVEKEGKTKHLFSYDGYYYYKNFHSQKDNTDYIMRARGVSPDWPPVLVNPLYTTFGFVINDTDPKNFGALTNPTTWDAFAERITEFHKDPETGIITFSCESRDASGEVKTTYEVKATLVDEVYFPISVKAFYTKDKSTYYETEVTKTLAETKSTFGLPFPVKTITTNYLKDTFTPQIIIEVDAESLAINQPVDDSIFTLATKGVKIIDVPEFSFKH